MTEKVDSEARLTIQQTADFLGVSRRTIYNHGKKGLLKIQHEKGKPFVTRGSVDGFLEAKDAGIKKTKYVPDGHIVIREDSWHQTRQIAEQMTVRNADLSKRVEHLLTYEKQVAQDAERIAELDAERQRLADENDKLKQRGLFARVFNKGVE